MEFSRRAGAYAAYRNAKRWARPVMLVGFVMLTSEFLFQASHTEFSPIVRIVGAIVAAAAFCGACWGIWVCSAAAVGAIEARWLRAWDIQPGRVTGTDESPE